MKRSGLPWLGAPLCQWHSVSVTATCGALAEHHMTTHDFEHPAPDNISPDAIRTWLICAGCLLAVLVWAQAAQHAGDGFYCKDCGTMLPALGGFLLSHGAIDTPEGDKRYDI